MLTDLRLALRLLRSQPSFTAAVVLTLALGTGANTAVFSILDASLLKPLPFRDPGQLVDIREVLGKGTAEERFVSGMTRQRLDEWRAQTHIFAGIEAERGPRAARLEGTDATVRIAEISPGAFPLLGIAPLLGRGLAADDRDDALLIAEGFWQRVFSADRAVIGRSIVLDGKAFTVIGVMPATARFPLGAPIDAWARLPDRVDPTDPSSAFVGVVARLLPEWSVVSAQPAVDAAGAAIQAANPQPRPWGANLDPIDPRSARGPSNSIVVITFAAVTLLLLTACANIATLLLARGWSRQRELAIRHALGASRWQMARLVIIEATLLSASGGAVGIVLASWIVNILPALLPPRLVALPAHEVVIDLRVLAFAVASAAVVATASSFAPSVKGSRAAAAGAGAVLTAHARVALPPTRARDAFIALQVTFAVILLVGAGLLSSSFIRLASSDPGYAVDGLLALTIESDAAASTDAPRLRVVEELSRQARLLPGVTAATFGVPPPQQGAGSLVAERSLGDPSKRGGASLFWCGPDYFSTLRIAIVQGRPFDSHEAGDTAIIDEDGARYFWPGENPIGQRVRYSPYVPWLTVIGVARNVKTGRAGVGADRFELYMPATAKSAGRLALIVRTASDASGVVAAIKTLLHAVDSRAHVTGSTVEALYGPSLMNPRFTALMMSVFAALALVTAGVGLYGALAYAVTTRIEEIGVRVALGATTRDVLRLLAWEGLTPVAVGMSIGLIASHWGARAIASQLYRVGPSDPVTLVIVVAIVLIATAAAASAPVVRAVRVDPAALLRGQ